MSIDGIGAVQHYHLFWTGTVWQCDQITAYGVWIPAASWAGGTPAGDASRMRIVTPPNGRTYAIGCWPTDGKRGRALVLHLTPDDGSGTHPVGYVPNGSVGSLPTPASPSGCGPVCGRSN